MKGKFIKTVLSLAIVCIAFQCGAHNAEAKSFSKGNYSITLSSNSKAGIGVPDKKSGSFAKLKSTGSKTTYTIKEVNSKKHYYTIKNKYSGKFLAIKGTGKNAKIVQKSSVSKNTGYFQFVSSGNSIRIKAVGNGQYITADSKKTGAKMATAKKADKSTQKWKIKAVKKTAKKKTKKTEKKKAATVRKNTNVINITSTTYTNIQNNTSVAGVNVHFTAGVPQEERSWWVNKVAYMPAELRINVSDLYIVHSMDEIYAGERAFGYPQAWCLGFTVPPSRTGGKSTVYLLSRSRQQGAWQMHCDLDNLYHEFGHALDTHKGFDGSYKTYSSLPEWKSAQKEWTYDWTEKNYFGGSSMECFAEAVSWYYNNKLGNKPITKKLVGQVIAKKRTNLFWDANPWQ